MYYVEIKLKYRIHFKAIFYFIMLNCIILYKDDITEKRRVSKRKKKTIFAILVTILILFYIQVVLYILHLIQIIRKIKLKLTTWRLMFSKKYFKICFKERHIKIFYKKIFFIDRTVAKISRSTSFLIYIRKMHYSIYLDPIPYKKKY